MVPERWSDERLDDLAQQVRMVAAVTGQVVTHEAEIKEGRADEMAKAQEKVI